MYRLLEYGKLFPPEDRRLLLEVDALAFAEGFIRSEFEEGFIRDHTMRHAFLHTRAGREALKLFERARLPVKKRTVESVESDWHTLMYMLRACYSARTWQGDGHRPGDNAKALKRRLDRLARCASEFARALREHGADNCLVLGFGWYLRAALKAVEGKAWVGYVDQVKILERELRMIDNDGRQEYDEFMKDIRENIVKGLAESRARAPKMESRSTGAMWADFFSELAASLRAESGPSLNTTAGMCGNLIYSRRIRNKAPNRETMLAFELVFYLRLWSLGAWDWRVSQPMPRKRSLWIFEPLCAWPIGHPMPREGKPHYAIAAAFVRAALGLDPLDITAETLKERLKRLPNSVRLGNW